MVKPIVVVGNPILKKSMPELDISKGYAHIVRDLWDTLSYIGAAGLAANQIGYVADICVIKKGSLTLINPVIVHRAGRMLSVEGCFSIPGYEAIIPRARTIRVVSFRPLGSIGTFQEFNGEQAMVVQHEVDHLNGILISDYVDEEKAKRGGVLISQYDEDFKTAVAYKRQTVAQK